MQTISVPYTTDEESAKAIHELRRIQSAAVRTAYANAVDGTDKPLKQKALRDLVKSRFAGGGADAWLLHTATLEGMACRARVPDGSMVFGGKGQLRRRSKGLIDRDQWRLARLRPLVSAGDKTQKGNRHFRLSADGLTCTLSVYGNPIALHLAEMRGKHGAILRQIAKDASEGRVNVQFSLGDEKLNVTVDDAALSAHPDRRSPQTFAKNRILALDLNPNAIGVSVIEVSRAGTVKVLDWKLIDLVGLTADSAMDRSVGAHTDRAHKIANEVSEVAETIADMARAWNVGLIALEQLKNLPRRDRGFGARHNRLVLNLWNRTFLAGCLRRHCRQRGLEVAEISAAYSSTIGNVLHDYPDAVAASIEIGRRAFELRRGCKDRFYPKFSSARTRRWKDASGIAGAKDWVELHRELKRAKIRVRRPHPVTSSGTFAAMAFMSEKSRVRLWRQAQTPTVRVERSTLKSG